MSSPYDEKIFNQLHKDLHDPEKKTVSVILSDLFKQCTNPVFRKEISMAIQRVARRRGFRTIIQRDTGTLSIMEFYRYDYHE